MAARTGSSRLPGKALLPLCGVPMITFLLRRLRDSRLAGRIVLATTSLPADDALEKAASDQGIAVFRGDPADLIKRHVDAAKAYPCEYAVRVTADCPFTDGESLDLCLSQCETLDGFDLASTKRLFPVGIDYEVYRTSTMERMARSPSLDGLDREHLTLHLYRHPEAFALRPLYPPRDWPRPQRAFTVDTEEDYRFASALIEKAGGWKARVKTLLETAA